MTGLKSTPAITPVKPPLKLIDPYKLSGYCKQKCGPASQPVRIEI